MSAFGGETDIKTKLLTKDEARRIAANIAKLPERCGSRNPVPKATPDHFQYASLTIYDALS
jgi:hypothetical protein